MKFGELYKSAQEAGAIQQVLPDGDFIIECINGNAGTTQAGDDKIGLQFQINGPEESFSDTINNEGNVVRDPARGAKAWFNLTFGEKAANISMRQLKDFGLTDAFLESAETAEDVANALKGVVLDVEVGHRNWGKNGENVSNTFKVHEVVVAPVLPAVSFSDSEDEEPF